MKHNADFKFQPRQNFNNSIEDIELPKAYYVYQTSKLIKNQIKNNFDFCLVLDINSIEGGDFFI